MTDGFLSQRIALGAIRIATILILFLPLVVTQQTFFPYIFGKAIFFQILVEIAFVFWVYLMIVNARFRPSWRNPMNWIVAGYAAVVVVAGALGVDPSQSFWSNHERMGGTFMHLHLATFAIMLGTVCQTRASWDRLFFYSIISAVLVGLYGIGQLIHLPFFLSNATGERLSSTLGNPIYLGVYALTHVWLSLYLLTQTDKTITRIVLSVAACFFLVLIALSGSRAAILVAAGSLASLCLLGTSLFVASHVKRSRLIVTGISLAIALVLFGGMFVVAKSIYSSTNLPEPLSRVVKMGLVDRNRLELWAIGIKGFIERPILGWGGENYNKVYYKYALPQHNGVRIQEAWFDRSHNQLVDVLSMYGSIGFLLYAALWIAIALVLYRRISQQTAMKEAFGLAMIAGACISYFIQNLFVFDSTVPVVMFAVLVAFLISIQSEGRKIDIASRNPGPALSVSILASTTVGIAAMLFFANVLPMQKSAEGISALSRISSNPEQSLFLMEHALSTNAYVNPEIRRALANALSGYGSSTHRAAQLATEELEKSVREHRGELRDLLTLSSLYRMQGVDDAVLYDKALSILDSAEMLAPHRLEVFYERALTIAAKGDALGAQDVIRKARELDPENGKTYWYEGLVKFDLKKIPEALSALRGANERGYDPRAIATLFLAIAKGAPSSEFSAPVLKELREFADRPGHDPLFTASYIIALSRSGSTSLVRGELSRLEKINPTLAHEISAEIAN